MQLDIEKTKISVVEDLVYQNSYAAVGTTPIATVYTAEVNGESVEGHTITMSREGSSPDAAIKALFEAMTEAGVTL